MTPSTRVPTQWDYDFRDRHGVFPWERTEPLAGVQGGTENGGTEKVEGADKYDGA